MSIAIIGRGQVGNALGRALSQAGRQILFASRRPKAADETTIEAAIRDADAIILAVPYPALPDVVAAAGCFVDKIVVDATNPLGMGRDGLGLTLGFSTSGAEELAGLAPRAKVFKAFNQTGLENLGDARTYPARPVMFVAGDDEAAKPFVLRLAEDAGFEALDIGALSKARLLEPLAMLWIELARKRGLGPHFTFTLQRKDQP